MVAAATALVAGFAAWNPLGLKDASTGEAAARSLTPLMKPFLIGWAAVLAGALVHIAVDTSKRMQETKQFPPMLAPGDVPFVVSAKPGQFGMKMALALVGFFGAVITFDLAMLVTPLSKFLVGDSLDSFVGLFATKLEQQSERQLSTLKESTELTGAK